MYLEISHCISNLSRKTFHQLKGESMKHEEVKEIVAKWLQNKHTLPEIIGKEDFMPDILVYTEQQSDGNKTIYHRYLQVECKKTNDSIERALGQCLHYYTIFNGLFTYLAVPADFSKLQELQEILGFVNLPIGLLIVHHDGRVETIKEAEGKETERELSNI